MKLSILVPAHNEEDNIEDAVATIIKTVPSEIDYEIVVVNDHSTDNTAVIVEKLNLRHVRFIELAVSEFDAHFRLCHLFVEKVNPVCGGCDNLQELVRWRFLQWSGH